MVCHLHSFRHVSLVPYHMSRTPFCMPPDVFRSFSCLRSRLLLCLSTILFFPIFTYLCFHKDAAIFCASFWGAFVGKKPTFSKKSPSNSESNMTPVRETADDDVEKSLLTTTTIAALGSEERLTIFLFLFFILDYLFQKFWPKNRVIVRCQMFFQLLSTDLRDSRRLLI